MQALGIVEGFDVIEEHGTGLGAIFRDSILEAFGFERGEKAFHGRVIVATALAAHTRGDVVDFEACYGILGRRIERRDRNDAASEPDQLLTARWKASTASGAANESSRFQPAIRFEHRSISAAR